MSTPTYEVLLEKKGRGRAFALARPWAVRTFKLKGQGLEYYDSSKLKGTIDIKDAVAIALTPHEADEKSFPFAVETTDKEKLLLNASCEEIRQRSIQMLNLAAKNANWTMPPAPGSETAAAEEVISLMAASAEKAKLEAEAKRLEEERLKEVTTATAKLMEEELANVKLREAAAAEQKQKEEHERQVMEMFKTMGAKQRFFAARKEGKLDVAREAAAVMVQNSWRSKLSYRRMLVKKAEKEAKRREGYARKIQCRYRVRLSKRRVAQIKAEKQRIKERIAAIKFQCAWRSLKTRRTYKEKLDKKMEKEMNKSISRQRGMIKAQSLVRRFLAMRRVARKRIPYPMIAEVCVDSVEGVKKNEDISAVVSGLVLAYPIDHPALVHPNYPVTIDMIKAAGKVTSNYKVDSVLSVKKTVLATALNKLDYVVITLFDKAASNELIGQGLLKVSDVVNAKTPIHQVTLNPELILPISDSDGNAIVLKKGPNRNSVSAQSLSPVVSVTCSIAPSGLAMCGWLWKVSDSLLSNAWKRRWFILHNGQLSYYNHDLGLEHVKNVVNCLEVMAMKEDSYKGRKGLKISFTANGVESAWTIDFDETESKSIKDMWIRKLHMACPALGSGSTSSKSPVSPKGTGDGKTKIPVSRRVSIFR